MKRTFLTILASEVVTSVLWYSVLIVFQTRHGIDELWLISAVKAPMRMALDEIDGDLQSGRLPLAKLKLAALKSQWSRFDAGRGFQAPDMGNILNTFGEIDKAADRTAPLNQPSPSPAINRNR